MKQRWIANTWALLAGLIVVACSSAPAAGPAAGTSSTTGAAPTSAVAAAKPTQASQPAAAATPTELRIGMTTMPRSPNFDPMQTSSSNPEFTNLYDALTAINLEGKLEPALATEWKRIDDLTWEFKLRRGVKFHNGEPFTAESVKFSADRILAPESKSVMKPFLNFIDSVSIVDDSTVRFKSTGPYGVLPLGLARLFVVPARHVKQVGDEAFNTTPVGTGPYKWVEWQKGRSLTLAANEDYWDGTPTIKKLTFLSAPEASTRVAMLLNNEADVIDQVLTTDVERINADARLQTIVTESSFVNYITVPTTRKPFDDKRVRQALNYAVDVDTIIAKILGGHATRTSVANAPISFGYDPSVAPYPYDVNKAKQLLTEAGNPTFPPMLLDAQDGFSPGSLKAAEAVASYLTAIGVPTKVNPLSNQDRLARNYSGQADFSWHGNNNQTFDSNAHYSVNFFSPSKGGRGIYYSNEQLDSLIIKAQESSEPGVRQQAYFDIHKMLKEEAPDIFLYTSSYLFGARKDLDWLPTKTQVMDFAKAKFK